MNLINFQSLTLDEKIHITEIRLLEFVHKMGGVDHVYIAFSGGKDSTVLLHIARNIFPNIKAVFSNTGLEFPEIVSFVNSVDNVDIIKPKVNFREVIIQFGYPLISKEVCNTINGSLKNPNNYRSYKLSGNLKGKSMFDSSKYSYLLFAPFRLNDKCCKIMKKDPFDDYNKKTNRKPIIGTLASESILRKKIFMQQGCNIFTKGKEISRPISIWKEEDIWNYINKNNLSISKIYEKGYTRSGCVFCAFGCHLEHDTNRFEKLRITHPNLFEYMMKDIDIGGLGFKMPLEYIGINIKDQVQDYLYL